VQIKRLAVSFEPLNSSLPLLAPELRVCKATRLGSLYYCCYTFNVICGAVTSSQCSCCRWPQYKIIVRNRCLPLRLIL